MAGWNLANSQASSLISTIKTQGSLILEDSIDYGDGPRVEQLSSVPPLIIMSSRVKRSSTLEALANPGVAVVRYDYEATSLTELLRLVGDRLKGRRALSIALVVHGQPGQFKLTRDKSVTLSAIKADADLKNFFQDLVSSYLFTEGDLASIDILYCPLEQSSDGKLLVKALAQLLNIPVYASEDLWGRELHNTGSNDGIKIGTLYFDGQKLKDWSTQTSQGLDKYEMIRIVGQGSFGQAVLYRRKEDDSLVILKKINILELNKTARQGVVNEINILSVLDHPHIISYYDNFEEDGQVMIEMEFADGGSLQQYLKIQQNPLPESEVITKFSQMVDALQYIHHHKIVHRDLKTANVFLTRHGIVKLGDFGISKMLSATLQAASTLVGTPYYISPEICEGKTYNSKSDIWSLGCILYEMLCLQRTFEGTNLPAIVHKIVEGSFQPIEGEYSTELKQLVKLLLQKDPDKRPTASDILSKYVAPLLSTVQGGLLHNIDTSQVDDQANAKSFLYQLDSKSLLFTPLKWPGQERIEHVALGYAHCVVVTYEMSVYSWGDNNHGQLGHGNIISCSMPKFIESLKGKSIKRVECGGEFSIFITEKGIAMSCGRGDKGALGHGDFRDRNRPELINELFTHDSHVISCGESHVALLTLDGKVLVWGANECGQLGLGRPNNCSTPTELIVRAPGSSMDETVIDVHCGIDCTVFITKIGCAFAAGSNTDNKLGLNRRETFIMQMKKFLNKQQLQVPQTSTPLPVKELSKYRVIDCYLGPTHSAFLTETGLVYMFGRNLEGQLGAGNCLPRDMASIVKCTAYKPIRVICSEVSTIVATENQSFLIWGSRPVIKSPLTLLMNGSKPEKELRRNPSSHLKVPGLGASPDSAATDVISSDTKISERSSNSSSESVKNPPTKGSKEIINKGASGCSIIIPQQGGSEISLSSIPYTQIYCPGSSEYLGMLRTNLTQALEEKAFTRQLSGVSINQKALKKVVSECETDGAILRPTVIDLADKNGILSDLWNQGMKDVKLENIACFACNCVILIHGHMNDGSSDGDNQLRTFRVGARLRRSASTANIGLLPTLPGYQNKVIKKDGIVTEILTEEVEEQSEQGAGKTSIEMIKASDASQTAEMMSWLAKELEHGIPMAAATPMGNVSTVRDNVDISVLGSVTTKGHSTENMATSGSDAIGMGLPGTGTGPPALRPLTSNKLLSSRKGTAPYNAISRSAQLIGKEQNKQDPFQDLSSSTTKATTDMKKPPVNQSQSQSDVKMSLIPSSKSITNLQTKSAATKTTLSTIQRTQSSSDVSKPKLKTNLSVSTKQNNLISNSEARPDSFIHKESEISSNSPSVSHGRTQSSSGAPPLQKRLSTKPQSNKVSTGTPVTLTKQIQSGISPYATSNKKVSKQEIQKSSKSRQSSASLSAEKGKSTGASLSTHDGTSIDEKEQMLPEHVKEKDQLLEQAKEQAHERELKMQQEIEELHRKLKLMEDNKKNLEQLKRQVADLEKKQDQDAAPVTLPPVPNSTKRSPRNRNKQSSSRITSRLCTLM